MSATRVLPTRTAKNKAKTIFYNLSDDEDSGVKSKKNLQNEKLKKSSSSSSGISKRNKDNNDDNNSPSDTAVNEKPSDDDGHTQNKNRKGKAKTKRKQKQKVVDSDDYTHNEEDGSDEGYHRTEYKEKPKRKRGKSSSKQKKQRPSSTADDSEEFYELPQIKIEPEDYDENADFSEYNTNNDDADEEEETDLGHGDKRKKKDKQREPRRRECSNITFNIMKQERTAGDQNTAVWTTSAFTITAVLPAPPKKNNNNVQNTEDSSSATNTNEADYVRQRVVQNLHKKIPCPLCSKEFRKMKLKRHLAQEHPGVEKPFKCTAPGCNTSWRSYDRMNDHLICHTDALAFKCDVCDKRFKRKYTLQAHVFYKHTEDGKASLSKFQTRRTAERIRYPSKPHPPSIGHKVGPYRIPADSVAPFKCPDCDVEEDTITRLQRHHAQSHQEKTATCETCGKGFPGVRELSIHVRCHRDGRPYVCEHCGSTYKSKAHLNSHILRTHDPEGHEAYKAYRRMTVRKLNARKKMEKELTKTEEPEETKSTPVKTKQQQQEENHKDKQQQKQPKQQQTIDLDMDAIEEAARNSNLPISFYWS